MLYTSSVILLGGWTSLVASIPHVPLALRQTDRVQNAIPRGNQFSILLDGLIKAVTFGDDASSQPSDCQEGGMCDCSIIEDKSSDQFLQCIMNANCEHCWHTVPSSTAAGGSTAITPADTRITSFPSDGDGDSDLNARSMPPITLSSFPPGTYTVTFHGIPQTIVVPPSAKPTCPPVHAPSPHGNSPMMADDNDGEGDEPSDDGDDDGASEDPPPAPPLPPPPTSASATSASPVPTTVPSNVTVTVTSVSTITITPPCPTPSCPGSGDLDNCGMSECDCEKIPDHNSEEYFQCITNPNCEHCRYCHSLGTLSLPPATTTSPAASDPAPPPQ